MLARPCGDCFEHGDDRVRSVGDVVLDSRRYLVELCAGDEAIALKFSKLTRERGWGDRVVVEFEQIGTPSANSAVEAMVN